jgi:ribosomal protein S5
MLVLFKQPSIIKETSMAPFVAMVLGTIVRNVITAAGAAGVATSPSVQGAGVAVGDDAQALVSAIGVVISLAWGMWQKSRVVRLPPVEEAVRRPSAPE